MHHSEITTLSIRDLIPHPSNPRKISQESLNRLCEKNRPFQFPFPANRGDGYNAGGSIEIIDFFAF